MSRPWPVLSFAGVAPLALLIATALGGCGGDDPVTGNTTTGAVPSVTTPRATPSRKTAERREIRRLANRYAQGLAGKRWKAVCSTRTRAEVKRYAQVAGSCERFFAAGFANRPEAKIFGTARASRVRIYGERATVTMLQPGQSEPLLTLDALKERGRWKLGKAEGQGGSPTTPDRPPTGPPNA